MLVNEATSSRLLVVSKDLSLLGPLDVLGEVNDWDVETVESGWDALERVQGGAGPDVVVLDLPRGDVESLHTLRWLRRLRPEIPVLIFAYAEDDRQKTEATRLGAQDYFVKPLQRKQLENALKRHLTQSAKPLSIAHPETKDQGVEQIDNEMFLITCSPVMRKLRAQAELLAQVNVPVLITGESGTGKDLIARLIHKLSDRAQGKFLKMTCGAFEGDLLEAELFGVEPGASGGRGRIGQLEACHRGTLLLDEITEIPMNVQAKLLQIMHDRKMLRVGGDNPVKVDLRVLATTSEKINEMVAAKKLRDDFYYQLSAFMVHVPPLRLRKDDIPLLMEHVMHQVTNLYGLPGRAFSPAVLDASLTYSWPGNLRELENFVKRYMVVGEDDWALGELDRKRRGGGAEQSRELMDPTSVAIAPALQTNDKSGGLKSLIRTVRGEAERSAIADALHQTRWNRKAAARLLQVSYRTLLYKIEHYHMSPPSHLTPFMNANCQKVSGQGN
jgi:two-component system response regulator AtoC